MLSLLSLVASRLLLLRCLQERLLDHLLLMNKLLWLLLLLLRLLSRPPIRSLGFGLSQSRSPLVKSSHGSRRTGLKNSLYGSLVHRS